MGRRCPERWPRDHPQPTRTKLPAPFLRGCGQGGVTGVSASQPHTSGKQIDPVCRVQRVPRWFWGARPGARRRGPRRRGGCSQPQSHAPPMSTELYLSGHCTSLASGQEFVTLRLRLYLSVGGLQNGSGGRWGAQGPEVKSSLVAPVGMAALWDRLGLGLGLG